MFDEFIQFVPSNVVPSGHFGVGLSVVLTPSRVERVYIRTSPTRANRSHFLIVST